MRNTFNISILAILVFFNSVFTYSQTIGKVINFSDGDSFIILDSINNQIKIRLYGIDCPEYSQEFGNMAKKFTSKLIFKENVILIENGYDKYGRLLAIVIRLTDSLNINEELLINGLAWHYKFFDQNPYWDELEKIARNKKNGLWAHSNPITPWEYRRNRK